jgi:hypothetical protein
MDPLHPTNHAFELHILIVLTIYEDIYVSFKLELRADTRMLGVLQISY